MSARGAAETSLTLGDDEHGDQAIGRRPSGLIPFVGAGLSLAFCFGNVLLGVAASVMGLPVAISSLGEPLLWTLNPHVQAVLMGFFALIVVFGLLRARKGLDRSYPTVVGVVATFVIIGTLYTYYDVRILMFGYFLLFVAALLNQTAMLGALNRTVRQQANELATLNRTLERRVEAQVEEIERLGRLRRFLSPEVAEIIVSSGSARMLASHRSFVVALFCDLRGFTAFSDGAEPEEAFDVLKAYHERLGGLVSRHEATIDHRAGDGLMVFINDPLPCERPVRRAIELALAMRDAFRELNASWERSGYQLGFGVGIASGYATLGLVGDEARYDYTANGNVINLASRLCDEARDGQVLVSRKAFVDVEEDIECSGPVEFVLKGFAQPVTAYQVIGLSSHDGSRPAPSASEPGSPDS